MDRCVVPITILAPVRARRVMGATLLRWRAQPPGTAGVRGEGRGAFDVDVGDS